MDTEDLQEFTLDSSTGEPMKVLAHPLQMKLSETPFEFLVVKTSLGWNVTHRASGRRICDILPYDMIVCQNKLAEAADLALQTYASEVGVDILMARMRELEEIYS